MGEEVSLQATWGQLVALIVAGSREERGVQWRRDLPRLESKENVMTLGTSGYDAHGTSGVKTLVSAKGQGE
jgi:hypothetical protein